MQSDSYYSIDRMSNSMMKHFRRSPRHYLYEKNIKTEPTTAMVDGQAFHCLVFEEESFANEFCVAPECDRRTTDGKKRYADFQLTMKPGQQILSSGSMTMIKAMRESVYADKSARELLDKVKYVERPFMWTDDVTGVECKSKIDGGCDEFTIDLKSCIDADPLKFATTAYNDYLTQPAFYVDGRGANNMNKGDFYFICVEKTPPYAVSVLKCSDEFLKQGRFVYGEILESFAHWKTMGSPDVGYDWKNPLGYHYMNLPSWVK